MSNYDKNGWEGTANPGKIKSLSMWENKLKGNNKDNAPKKRIPKKVDIWNEAQTKLPMIVTDDNNKDNGIDKSDMIAVRGKCITLGCKCDKYIENPSKWSKGKCKSCNHVTGKHKETFVKKSSANGIQTATTVKPQPKPSPAKPVPAVVPAAVAPVTDTVNDAVAPVTDATDDNTDAVAANVDTKDDVVDDVDNAAVASIFDEAKKWFDENGGNFAPDFTERLKETVEDNFIHDDTSIIQGKYILHYLKKRIGFDFSECTGGHRFALKYVLIQLFDVKIVNMWGYNIRLVKFL